jgi:hypothetical protein
VNRQRLLLAAGAGVGLLWLLSRGGATPGAVGSPCGTFPGRSAPLVRTQFGDCRLPVPSSTPGAPFYRATDGTVPTAPPLGAPLGQVWPVGTRFALEDGCPSILTP